MPDQFRARLKQGEVLLGPIVTLGSGDVVEVMAIAGFDWLWVDLEHAATDLSSVQALLQAAAGRIPCIVRVPWNDEVWIKRVLDTGCDGIIVPQIRSAKEAEAAVRASKYPPAGTRSVGIGRGLGYGVDVRASIAQANERLTVVLQAEHIDAVENLDEILSVPGIDAMLIGPFDLSGSMGLTGQVDHPDVLAAIAKIKAGCAAKSIPVGIFAVDQQAAKRHIDAGCTLIGLGIDTMYLWKAAKQAIAELRPTPSG